MPLLAAALTGCSILGPSTPAAVVPTLDSWGAAGLPCSGPFVDNVPNGLLQWRCNGVVNGIRITATLDGDTQSVFQIVGQVRGGTDRATSASTFQSLVKATAALAPVSDAASAWLSAWDGTQAQATFGTAWLLLLPDPTWITLSVFPGPRRSVDQVP